MSAHTLRETSTPQPPMSLPGFLQRLGDTPQQIEFSETMEIIDAHYGYTPTAFRNGDIGNAAGQNAGSCKLFAFARLQGLSEPQTLACFGRYYREDVLPHPQGQDHPNIRSFMRGGWAGIDFDGEALRPR